MGSADEVPGDPKIKPTGHQGDFFHELDVNLEPGQHFFAARDPLWLSEGLVSRPVDGGIRWDAPAGGTLRFGIESGANLARLVWVRPGATPLTAAPGPGGRAWARIDGTATAVLHTWHRPPAAGGR
jgi:hypothetical protein